MIALLGRHPVTTAAPVKVRGRHTWLSDYDVAGAEAGLHSDPLHSDPLTGETVGQYRVIEQLGGGGMGVVYRAEDTRLGRFVALKFLSADLPRDVEAVERFRREARIASSLNHPHICTVHDLGQHGDRQFIVMELLEGETLKYRIGRGALRIDDVIKFGIEIADALDSAHEKGIIHRDIKPANIFITRRGQAKVLDFGLAKLAPEAAAGAASADETTQALPEAIRTSPGTTLGTVAYMSPEQARAEELDARTDLFSLGVVLYEMATGARAFSGATTAVVFEKILREPPTAPVRLNPAVPAELERIIRKAIEKDRTVRYQTASDLRADLERLRRASGTVATRPLRRRWWVYGACVAVAAVLAAIATILKTKPTAALTDRDSIVLADFTNTTGDPTFDDTLKTALAVQLGQSPFLDIVAPDRVRDTLKFMTRSPDERLPPAVAREVCQRLGCKAMLAGSIHPLGSRLVVSLESTNCETGETLARAQQEAERKEDVLRALGAASSSIRERLGESLASIRKFDEPITQVTTSSLDALKLLSLAEAERAKGREIEAVPFLKRAIELDPEFALAHAQVATVYTNLREPGQAAQYALKAYELRDRVSERERFAIEMRYHFAIERNPTSAVDILELWAKTYPRDWVPVNALCLVHQNNGEYDKAIDAGLEALRRNPNHPFPYSNLGSAYAESGRLSEAKQIWQQAFHKGFATMPTVVNLYAFAAIAEDAAAADHYVRWANGHAREYEMSEARAEARARRGQFEAARILYEEAALLAEARGLRAVAAAILGRLALAETLVGHAAEARRLLKRIDHIQLPNEAALIAAEIDALVGSVERAETVAVGIEKLTTTDAIGRLAPRSIRSLIAFRRGHLERALDLRSPVPTGLWSLRWRYFRALIYLAMKKPREAITDLEAIRDKPGLFPLSIYHALAPLQSARALALAGDTVRSREAYERFLDSWKAADGGIPILQEAKRELAAVPRK